jgi:2-polyprenyl-3-methyl-5-hydroxy-6-metoxy-1,4-benzoquinol methylase
VARWPAWECPAHAMPLAEERDGLVCPRGERFACTSGIPRFVESQYTASFGAQWNRYTRTQLDSHTGTTISRDRARRCLGESLWESLRGLHVLEAGCGAGRFTEVLLQQGAYVTSIDMSEAVEANAHNFPPSGRHRIAQADITRLPFADGAFDVVFCLGVVQHTPSPEATIAALYRKTKPGGSLLLDHYTYSKALLSLTYVLRLYFRRLPPEKTLPTTERLVDALLPLHRRAGRLSPLLTRFSPVHAYYRTHPELSPELQREWALLDTHDALTDHYKRLRTCGQIRRVLQRLHAEDIRCWHGGNGVEARARKPAPTHAGAVN